ncbi:hypothetical protein [Lacticaseibacillus camelliae]|uniref:Uncharacterized protein n=1 Tax=Lacticaseibacillus camelliae DSM 22697 = JCM 13995 TaxID=1423730 RepID=A0A0R2FH08_9LACO|nr:hypothetical protein [Lacticaseibacillus camelliae]KRN25349.1 hypothetical protein FC75_GL000619 [Lacticaseibacillus camelliae DSM 22697 = JCM 13995]
MTKRRASALISAIMLLLLVTLISGAALRQFAIWRVAYERRLTYEQKAFADAYVRWKRVQSPNDGDEVVQP